jgi:hypothetical protein
MNLKIGLSKERIMNYSISFKAFRSHCKHRFPSESYHKDKNKFGCSKLISTSLNQSIKDEIYRKVKYPPTTTFDVKSTACTEKNCPIMKRLWRL